MGYQTLEVITYKSVYTSPCYTLLCDSDSLYIYPSLNACLQPCLSLHNLTLYNTSALVVCCTSIELKYLVGKLSIKYIYPLMSLKWKIREVGLTIYIKSPHLTAHLDENVDHGRCRSEHHLVTKFNQILFFFFVFFFKQFSFVKCNLRSLMKIKREREKKSMYEKPYEKHPTSCKYKGFPVPQLLPTQHQDYILETVSQENQLYKMTII